MTSVLLLFLIPVGGGIPAGVLLARAHHLAWPVTAGLYCVSDILLAFLFEPVLRLLMLAGKRVRFIAIMGEAMKLATSRATAHYGGAGPVALILVAFGVDPMTGRAAAAAAGHGFVAGWAIAIAGDMLYFGVVMAATLRLNAALGSPNRTMFIILAAMFLLPVLIRRLKRLYLRLALPGGAA